MKYFFFIIIMLPIIATAQSGKNTQKVDSLNGKPTYYYLNHDDIDDMSKAFYSGQFSVGDNEETKWLIDSIFTDNAETRPFYFYNFNRILSIADKGTAEDAGMEAKDFIEKNPCFFFKCLGDTHFNIELKNWVQPIGYAIGTQKALDIWGNAIEPILTEKCKQFLIDWNGFKAQVKKEIQ